MEEKEQASAFHDLVINRLENVIEENEREKVFDTKTFISECCIISLSLLLVPILAVCVILFWPETPQKLSLPNLEENYKQ